MPFVTTWAPGSFPRGAYPRGIPPWAGYRGVALKIPGSRPSGREFFTSWKGGTREEKADVDAGGKLAGNAGKTLGKWLRRFMVSAKNYLKVSEAQKRMKKQMFLEEDFIQLSALQHFVFCPRQCALIHIEQMWGENLLTAEGRIMHERAHAETFEIREGIRIERGMPLRSDNLGLNGKADVIEFHKAADGKSWIPFPVEYKRGKPKADNCDKVQLCAQALCLEEMMKTEIRTGAIFYGRTKRRQEVIFDPALREETKKAVFEVHEFIKTGKTPKPFYAKKCEACSLVEVCMPKTMGCKRSVREYCDNAMREENL